MADATAAATGSGVCRTVTGATTRALAGMLDIALTAREASAMMLPAPTPDDTGFASVAVMAGGAATAGAIGATAVATGG